MISSGRLTATATRGARLLAKARFDPAKGVVAVGAHFAGVDAAHAPVDFGRFVSTMFDLGMLEGRDEWLTLSQGAGVNLLACEVR